MVLTNFINETTGKFDNCKKKRRCLLREDSYKDKYKKVKV